MIASFDAGLRIRFGPSDRQRRIAEHCAADAGVGRACGGIDIDPVFDGSRASDCWHWVLCRCMHGAGRVRVEPLGDDANAGRAGDGGALVEFAKRGCEFLGDRGAVD